ncbi:YALIA101S05e05754g1_1 [Yarrowia lipolytica]|nr:MFS transporter asaE [Yarrowia lipolytica]SEI34583.1 YALIA101S05e05754g1_1 [Yarrowia lipolytica]VBB79087.1 Plasma membrane riboflavin transporter, putative [Yarrowia lipolytica]
MSCKSVESQLVVASGSISEKEEPLVQKLPEPDRGRAWIAMVGGALGLYSSFGYINVVGLFEAYYLHHQLDGYSASTVSWITSLQFFILLVGGVFFGRLAEMYGPRPVAIVGMLFTVGGIMATSECKTYYQFLLAQGICTSIGNSCVYYASMVACNTWFVKRRATALGVVVGGSSIGGVTLPFVFSQLQPKIGFNDTVRVIGYIMLGVGVICCVCISSRLPPNKKLRKNFFNFRQEVIEPYKNKSFAMMTAALFVSYWGLVTTMGYMSTHAISHGMSETVSFYLVAIYNGASFLGRILPGIMADKVGTYNMHSVCCVLCGIILLAFWIPSNSNAAFFTFSGVFGFISGPYIGLFAALVAEVSEPHEIGRRLGVVTFFCSWAALTAMPIAGATLDEGHTSFVGLQVFAGVTMMVGGFMVFAAKMQVPGQTWLSKF